MKVLVTGAGGSIGSEIVRQLLAGRADVIGLDHHEDSLYRLMEAHRGSSMRLTPALVDVRDQPAVRRVFERHQPTHVVHAAAYKHVPMLEDPENALQGLLVNVLGAWNVVMQGLQDGCRVMFVSTDKAVLPSSFYGVTKRLAELVCIGAAREWKHPVDVVRFGNVMGSNGSVIPLFRQQIEAGGPVTVTHREMTRWMMSIHDAVALVLDVADRIPRQGCTLSVLDMGEEVGIWQLAERMVFEAGGGIRIEETGIRPGEKLHERLWYDDERLEWYAGVGRTTLTLPDGASLWLAMLIDALHAPGEIEPLVRQVVKALVPEYGGQDPWWT